MTNDTTPLSDAAPEPAPRRSKRRWLLWGAVAIVALIALGYGAIFFYTEVLNDAPDELTAADLAEALERPADSTPTTAAPEPTTPSSEAGSTTTSSGSETTSTPTTGAVAASVVDGHWVVTDESELGYRVGENLFGVDTEGVGRTNQVTGGLDIAGTTVTDADFEVDMAAVESDDGRRDRQFRGRIMSVDEFPTSTFVLTQPIELGSIPAEGEQVTATATGDLTLRGVTNSVTFDVTAQFDGDGIGVLGQIPVVFADYGIANPSTPGVTTKDEGVLEFVLVLRR